MAHSSPTASPPNPPPYSPVSLSQPSDPSSASQFPPQPSPQSVTDVPPKPLPPFVSVLSRRPSFRVTTEFDSDSSVFFHKVSCKLLDSLAKLKLTFQNNSKGEVSEPQISLLSKFLSIHYDVEEQNALVKTSFEVGSRLHFKSFHDVKAQQGQVAVVTKLSDPGYALELSSPVPAVGLPRATLKFPFGEVSLEECEIAEEKRTLSISGLGKAQVLNGLCSATYSEEELKLRYCYKDEALSFIPSISLPSNALSFAFKRRFNPSNKLSYWYNFDSNNWSAVYKHTYGKDIKLKTGYDSEVRLGWASLWVGDEGGKAKTAPMKMKVQFMLQVPQDDIKSSALMFRVKKRWDL
ncbi:Outer envelope pore protein 37, chloroplastic [Linum grandiflorum]